MREVEAQAIGRNKRPFLDDVGAEDLAQRRVQEVRRGVVEHRRLARRAIHDGGDGVALAESASLDLADVQVRVAELARVGDAECRRAVRERADVADLAAGLGVEGRAVEHDLRVVALGGRVDFGAVLQDREHPALALELFIAAELAFGIERPGRAQVDAELAGGARAIALQFHLPLEPRLVDREPALTRDVGGQVHRETIGVVELEHRLAGDRLAPHLPDGGVEQRQAVLERLREAMLFLLQHLHDMVCAFRQLREGGAHLRHERRDERVEERLLLAELVAMADRAADDAPEHVAPAVVARDDPVDDQERAGADVVRDDAQAEG